jgi:hypothetical protein
MGQEESREDCRADYEYVLKITSRKMYVPGADDFEYETGSWVGGPNTLFKAVEFGSFVCPECSTVEDPVICYVDSHGDKPCPECGLLDTVQFPTIAPDLYDEPTLAERQEAVGQKWFTHKPDSEKNAPDDGADADTDDGGFEFGGALA